MLKIQLKMSLKFLEYFVVDAQLIKSFNLGDNLVFHNSNYILSFEVGNFVSNSSFQKNEK